MPTQSIALESTTGQRHGGSHGARTYCLEAVVVFNGRQCAYTQSWPCSVHAEHFGRVPSHYTTALVLRRFFVEGARRGTCGSWGGAKSGLACPYSGLAISAIGTRNNCPAAFRWPVHVIIRVPAMVIRRCGAERGLGIAMESVAARDWPVVRESSASHDSYHTVSGPENLQQVANGLQLDFAEAGSG